MIDDDDGFAVSSTSTGRRSRTNRIVNIAERQSLRACTVSSDLSRGSHIRRSHLLVSRVTFVLFILSHS